MFAIGDRVVVKPTSSYPSMDGYYGHVVAKPSTERVFVEIDGRTNREPMAEDIAHNNPWPFFNEELEHAD